MRVFCQMKSRQPRPLGQSGLYGALVLAVFAVWAQSALAFSDNRLDLHPSRGGAGSAFSATFYYSPTTGPCPPGAVSFVWDTDRTKPVTLGNKQMDTASCSATLSTYPPVGANGAGPHSICGFYASAPGSTDACNTYTIEDQTQPPGPGPQPPPSHGAGPGGGSSTPVAPAANNPGRAGATATATSTSAASAATAGASADPSGSQQVAAAPNPSESAHLSPASPAGARQALRVSGKGDSPTPLIIGVAALGAGGTAVVLILRRHRG